MLPTERAWSSNSYRLKKDIKLTPLTQRIQNIRSEYEYVEFDKVQYNRREQHLDTKFNHRKQRLVSISCQNKRIYKKLNSQRSSYAQKRCPPRPKQISMEEQLKIQQIIYRKLSIIQPR